MSYTHVVLHPQFPHGVDRTLEAMPGIRLEKPCDDAGVIAALEAGAEVLVTYTWKREFLTPSLRWIAGTGAGAEQYPFDLLRQAGVTLTNAAGVHAITVAEHAMALLLALTRRIGESMRNTASTKWESLLGEELYGKRMAIVGLGRIGEAIAERAQPWGMDLAGIKRRPAVYTGCLTDVRGPEAMSDLCDWADVLMLAAPARPDNAPLIRAEELQRLGAGWLVNVGRGSLVDQSALIAALANGQLRGAGLDVTTPEPLPAASPLWTSPKVVLSAHNAGSSPLYGHRWGKIFAHNLKAFKGDESWMNRLVPAT